MSGDDVVFPIGGGAVHLNCHRTAESTVSLTCRLCLIPIVSGDLAFFEGTALVHADCHRRAYAGGALGEFLESQPGRPYCHSCLARRLGLRWEIVRKAVWALRVSRSFDVRPGTCAQCQAARVVIAAIARKEQVATR